MQSFTVFKLNHILQTPTPEPDELDEHRDEIVASPFISAPKRRKIDPINLFQPREEEEEEIPIPIMKKPPPANAVTSPIKKAHNMQQAEFKQSERVQHKKSPERKKEAEVRFRPDPILRDVIPRTRRNLTPVPPQWAYV